MRLCCHVLVIAIVSCDRRLAAVRSRITNSKWRIMTSPLVDRLLDSRGDLTLTAKNFCLCVPIGSHVSLRMSCWLKPDSVVQIGKIKCAMPNRSRSRNERDSQEIDKEQEGKVARGFIYLFRIWIWSISLNVFQTNHEKHALQLSEPVLIKLSRTTWPVGLSHDQTKSVRHHRANRLMQIGSNYFPYKPRSGYICPPSMLLCCKHYRTMSWHSATWSIFLSF
jgi:hypothetical protein